MGFQLRQMCISVVLVPIFRLLSMPPYLLQPLGGDQNIHKLQTHKQYKGPTRLRMATHKVKKHSQICQNSLPFTKCSLVFLNGESEDPLHIHSGKPFQRVSMSFADWTNWRKSLQPDLLVARWTILIGGFPRKKLCELHSWCMGIYGRYHVVRMRTRVARSGDLEILGVEPEEVGIWGRKGLQRGIMP